MTLVHPTVRRDLRLNFIFNLKQSFRHLIIRAAIKRVVQNCEKLKINLPVGRQATCKRINNMFLYYLII